MSVRLGRLGRWLVTLATVLAVAGPALAASGGGSQWTTAGQNLQNTRYQSSESKIGISNAGNLAVKWQFTTGGDVSATPAVDGTTVYVPDWKGNLFAIDQKTGTQIWSHKVSDYTGVANDYVRSTPAIAGSKLIFGDQGGVLGAGARLMAVNKQTGSLLWVTQVDSHAYAIVTQSAVVDGAVVYVGVASFEEAAAAFIPGYTCCSFRGSVLALDANTGQILWKTYTVPLGYSGGAVWGSTPAVDHKRNTLYVDTGNNYSLPAAVQQCIAQANGNAVAEQACISPDNHFDSVMALDLTTGAVKWATAALPFDAWNGGCIFGNAANCPTPAGPDYDFGQGPALFTVNTAGSGGPRDLLGAGQKSGQYWALDPSTGAVVWWTQVGPGGIIGGLLWGSATDGNRIYVADANSSGTAWTLLGSGSQAGTSVTSGFWSAIDAATGAILWQTADPLGAQVPGAVSAANDVVYGCSLDSQGHMYAFNAATGAQLWSFASGGSCNAGAAISGGTVYWGSGYSNFGFGTPNNKIYAFTTP